MNINKPVFLLILVISLTGCIHPHYRGEVDEYYKEAVQPVVVVPPPEAKIYPIGMPVVAYYDKMGVLKQKIEDRVVLLLLSDGSVKWVKSQGKTEYSGGKRPKKYRGRK